ncbi:Beta-xylosidase/alpha-L-arabinofuranosidase 2 [Ananas comosus]|uniref:Beta-xylosidase/alpha-L-arabinofuranosidase 2 n=1 Tax=Ananas comosus TaxID=4615 RepID=A0A199UCF1_ANACO|nr:Beta-xylosidase/alpha-L-arabinofuranosidase 2 [Ananas comosus]
MAPPCSNSSPQSIFLLLVTIFAAVSHGDNSNSNPNAPLYTYKYICDPQRFEKLGLNMAQFGFCDKSLPYAVRAKRLVDSMALAEKVGQTGNGATGVQRLGIPQYNWWSEALHGVSDVGGGSKFSNIVPGATSFPTPITSAAAFNETLWKTIGEDVTGFETTDDLNTRPLKVSACCKHYAAYDVDAWYAPGNFFIDRYHYSANVTEQDMVETFLRPFEMCVKDGDVSSVMCSYNSVNGIPTCTDARLLRGTVRGDWNLHGYIVADCDSIEVIVDQQKYLADTPEDAVAQVLKGGLDLDCMSFYQTYLENATRHGLVKEADIDRALINNYIVLMRVGLFDGQPAYDSLNQNDICSAEHVELATDAARQGVVLLKNENNVLPLNTTAHKNIAAVGPHANATHVMLGNYAGTPCSYSSPLDGLSRYAKVSYLPGCLDVACLNLTYIFPAVRISKTADATIIFAGLDLSVEAESNDRSNLNLPGYQNLFIRQVASVAKGPVVLVILSAGGVNIDEFKSSSDIDAILWVGYPGEQGGNAIADVIYGKYNPGGRLPVTWYTADYVMQLPMTSMQLRPNDDLGFPGRTYKFYNGSTVYPFGFGLSYTNFIYTVVSTQRSVEKELGLGRHCHQLQYNTSAYIPPCQAAIVEDLSCDDDDVAIDVLVTNTGTVDGSHVVVLYATAPEGIIGAPIKQVIGFQRVFVAAGKSEVASFKLQSCRSLSIVTGSAYVALPAGEHTISVGDGVGAVQFPFQVYFKSQKSF